MWTRNFVQLFAALALAAAVAVPQPAGAEPQPAGAEAEPRSAGAEAEQAQDEPKKEQASREGGEKEDADKLPQLKVFQLKHREPQQLIDIIALADQEFSSDTAFSQNPDQVFPIVQPNTLRGQTTVGYRGVPGDEDKDKLVMAIDAQKKILFVRGSNDQIQTVEKLVQAFDLEKQELKPHEYQGLRLIPLESGFAQQARLTLSQLGLKGRMLQMGDISLFVFNMNDKDKEQVEQAEKVIQTLRSGTADADDSSTSDNREDDER